MKAVCVFTGSSFGADKAFEEAARSLGAAIAKRGFTLVYGGASVGLMGAVADSALAEGGEVIGVLPKALADLELAHTGLTELKIVDSMHARKTAMADAADAFVSLPGGLGTLEETFEVWTWTQLGVHAKPLGFVNVNGYYEGLLTFLDHAVASGFVKQKHKELALVDADPDALLEALAKTDVSYEPKWIDRQNR
ncbi:MAG: TIGR00730 family Rossman fold protein [Pseudomonadota bacterium]